MPAYRIRLSTTFETAAEIPSMTRFGEKAMTEFFEYIEQHMPKDGKDIGTTFKIEIQKVDEST